MSDASGTKTRLAKLHFGADHPSLPGHFPGSPIVPAVVLLSRIVDCALELYGAPLSITGIEQAKFLAPLLPGQGVLVTLTRESAQLKFKVAIDDAADNSLVAQGAFNVAADAA